METNRLVGRILYLAPLAALVLLLPEAPEGPLPPALSFIALSLYARMAAVAGRFSGREEALLFAEALPFFAYAAAFLSALTPAVTLLFSLEAAALWGALLWLEALLVPGGGGFAVAAVFIGASFAGGLAMSFLPAPGLLGLASLAIIACAYASARRAAA